MFIDRDNTRKNGPIEWAYLRARKSAQLTAGNDRRAPRRHREFRTSTVFSTSAISTQLVLPAPDAELLAQRTPEVSTSTTCAALRPLTRTP